MVGCEDSRRATEGICNALSLPLVKFERERYDQKLHDIRKHNEHVKGDCDTHQNIEGDSADQAPGVSKFSVTRWTIRAVCFNRIYLNYQELQSTSDECLEGGMNSELKARIIGCKAQMGTFDYFFGLQLGYRLFSHTDNLSKTLQGKRICAAEGQTGHPNRQGFEEHPQR